MTSAGRRTTCFAMNTSPDSELHPTKLKKKRGTLWLHLSDHGKQLLCIAIAGVVFTGLLLKVNHRLFTVPINEYSDYAANAIQIEDAKHFRDLLGNYSRWGFHHPGPAFFYILALGEGLLYDWLRVAPAPMNAQLITIILLNSTFLFLTIYIFAQYCRSRVFIPAAMALTVYFVYVINHTIAGSALVSVWMPYVLLFCFVLFVTASASVASGNSKHLPILALAGLMLLHGHVTQPLFVGPLVVVALAGLWFSDRGRVSLRQFIGANRTALVVSIALVVIFAIPILLDVVLHRPNNIQDILVHQTGYPGIQNEWGKSLKYEIGFFTFLTDPEVVLQNPSAHLLSRGRSHAYVVVCWCFWFCLASVAIGAMVYGHRRVPVFLRYLMAEIAIVLLLFYYWALRMSGPMFNFNGYFLYSVQLLMLLGIACFLLDGIGPRINWRIVLALSCAVPFLALTARPYFRVTETGWEETDRLIASLPADMGAVHVTFPTYEWLDIIGVISHMRRERHPFCITNDYWHLFDKEICTDAMVGWQNLIFARAPRMCQAPCRPLLQDSRFVLQLAPYPWLKLPFRVNGDGEESINENFYRDAGGMWSSKRSTIRFLLAPSFGQDRVGIRITGHGVPGRPVDVSLNGKKLGTILPGQHMAEFTVEGSALLPGHENRLTFEAKNAGPFLHDWRVIGFFVHEVEFFAPEQLQWIGDPISAHYHTVASGNCTGYIDVLEAFTHPDSPGLKLEGWAWSSYSRRAASSIVLTDKLGRILGFGNAGFERPDVRAARSEIGPARVGWTAYLPGSGHDFIEAYMVNDADNSACLVQTRKL